MYTPEERRLRNQLSQLDEIGTSKEQEDKFIQKLIGSKNNVKFS